jgi:hypothetical protein
MLGAKSGRFKECIAVTLMVLIILTVCAQFKSAHAQDLWPLDDNPLSPLSYFPLLRGEAKVAVFAPTFKSGYFEGPNSPKRDLKTYYKIQGGDAVFLDSMVRFQLGRFSSRTYYEWREFLAGDRSARNVAIDYSGIRQGFDVDIFLGNKSRVGFNIDCSFYGPKFSVLDDDDTPLRVNGPQNSWTIGVHGLYNPVWNLFGMSAVAEAWARWPVAGTLLTDYEVSGGLKSPETVLGSFSVQAGYRSTSISFSGKSQVNVNATWDGVFGQISYYYR